MALPHDTGLLADTSFWVLIAFVVFVYIGYRYGRNAVLSALDDRTERIKDELDQAERFRVEAQDLLAEYQHKQRDAMKEAETIVSSAKKQADLILEQADASLTASLERREKQAKEKIRQAEEKAVFDIQNKIIDLSTAAASDILKKNNDGKVGDRLIDESISSLKKIKISS
jgi:F-type H+-transporting ATPase subunit b